MKLIEIRENTHGNWFDQAALAMWLKDALRMEETRDQLTIQQQEALDMICTKIARIVCGNPAHKDHWDDIAGYANLGGQDAYPEPTSSEDGEVVVKVSKSDRVGKGRRKTP